MTLYEFRKKQSRDPSFFYIKKIFIFAVSKLMKQTLSIAVRVNYNLYVLHVELANAIEKYLHFKYTVLCNSLVSVKSGL